MRAFGSACTRSRPAWGCCASGSGRCTDGPIQVGISNGGPSEGVAVTEAFRGDVLVWLRLSAEGRIARCHVRDASWFQWPLLEAAIEGNIVADFPLCNKSFNCSYAGHDI